MKSLLDLIVESTGLQFRHKPGQRVHEGPCPFCGEGEDRFHIWHDREPHNYWCRRCGAKGDAIDFLRTYHHMSFHQALAYLELPGTEVHHHHNRHNHDKSHKDNGFHAHQRGLKVKTETLSPPMEAWLAQARPFVVTCHGHLMENLNPRALAWLHMRRLSDDTLTRCAIGYNPTDRYIDREKWGLPTKLNDKGEPSPLWLPRGITIPWWVDGELWGVRIRRPEGDPRYYWIPGGTPALYNGDRVRAGTPTILVEGEVDALTIAQATGDAVAAVATGSTHGARHLRWLARLATASTLLIAYDSDEAGETAAAWWLDALTHARRWRPYWADANAMAQDGVDIARWVQTGLLVTGGTVATLPEGARCSVA